MLTRDNRKPSWIFYPAWVALSALSVPIAWLIAWAFMSQVENAIGGTIRVGGETHITEDFLFIYFLLPLLGLLSGFLQYLLLRRYLPRIGWWIGATVLGWLLLIVVLGLLPIVSSPYFDVRSMWFGALAVVLMGGSTALPQWLVLRQRVRRAAGWILASVLGWEVALLLTDGAISSQPEVLSVVFLPPLAASIAWWLLLDKLPQRAGNGGNSPRDSAPEAPAPLNAH